MGTVTDPRKRIGFITGLSLGGTVAAWIVLGLFTSPVLYIALDAGSQAAGVVVLGIFGWGIWFGQQLLRDDMREEYEELREEVDEGGSYLMPLFTLVNLAYYNIVMFATLMATLFIATNGFPAVATVFALVYPAYDIGVTYRGYPLSIAGGLAVVIAIGIVIANLGEITWQEIDFGDVLYRVIGGRSQGFA